MAGNSQAVKTVLAIAIAATVIGAMWMIVEVGLKESWTVVSDPTEVDATTNSTFGGDISFDERLLVGGAFITILGPTGFGALTIGRKGRGGQPEFMNTVLRFGPLLIGAVAAVSVGSTVMDVLSSDYDWSAAGVSDGYHAYVLYITGAVVSAGAAILNISQGRRD